MSPTPRVTRPEPESLGPDRSAWIGGQTFAGVAGGQSQGGGGSNTVPPAAGSAGAFGAVPPTGPGGGNYAGSGYGGPGVSSRPPPGDADTLVSDSVADSVKLAYQVIRENIEQGRLAAARFREGEYNVRDVPHDVNVLTLRLLELSRELTRTSFDVLERVLRSPRTPGAEPWTSTSRAWGYDPRRFDQGRQPFYPDWRQTGYPDGQAPYGTPYPSYGDGQPPPSQYGAQSPFGGAQSSPILLVSCRFVGPGGAEISPGRVAVKTAALMRPAAPTQLTVRALVADSSSAAAETCRPPILGATIAARSQGGVEISVPIADSQPAGIYSGVICDDDNVAVGVLSIVVNAPPASP